MKQLVGILGKGWLVVSRNALLIACILFIATLFVTTVSLPSTPVSETVIYTTDRAGGWSTEP